MRTDFPYELYSFPIAVRVATKLSLTPPQCGDQLYIYFEHTVNDYWVITATEEVISALTFNMSLSYWESIRDTSYWYDMIAHNQVIITGLKFDTVRKWYPEGNSLTNEVLLA